MINISTKETEDKYNKFNLTNEMVNNFHYLATIFNKSKETKNSYTIKTILLGDDFTLNNKQGVENAELG